MCNIVIGLCERIVVRLGQVLCASPRAITPLTRPWVPGSPAGCPRWGVVKAGFTDVLAGLIVLPAVSCV